MGRVAVYVDWFNVYRQLKKNFWKKYNWLNYKELASHFLIKDDKIVKIVYFSAYYPESKDNSAKHKNYVRVLQQAWIIPVLWKYQQVTRTFINKWNNLQSFVLDDWESREWFPPYKLVYRTYEEKKTDVNIAVNILRDWLDDLYDKCFIISWDSDITPAIESVKKRRKDKKFICILPPWSNSTAMKNVCHKTYKIKESDLQDSQFPDIIKWIQKPEDWT